MMLLPHVRMTSMRKNEGGTKKILFVHEISYYVVGTYHIFQYNPRLFWETYSITRRATSFGRWEHNCIPCLQASTSRHSSVFISKQTFASFTKNLQAFSRFFCKDY